MKAKNGLFIIIRSTANTETAAVLLKDIYKDGGEYVIGGYKEETAFTVFKAIKTTLQQIEEWEKTLIDVDKESD